MAATTVLRTQLAGALRRPGRVLMTGLSVLVAAFVVFGTVLAYEMVSRTTLDTFSDTPAAVGVVVSSESESLTAAQLADIRRTPGVRQAAGRTTASFKVGDSSSAATLDVDADPGSGPLSRVKQVSGAYPGGARQIALDRRAADRLGARPGSTLRLRGGDPDAAPIKVRVTGIVDGPHGAAERGFAPDAVVAALRGAAKFARVDVLTEPGVDPDAVLTRLSERLMRDPNVYLGLTTGKVTRIAEARAAVRQFDQIFALVGMFVAIAVVAAALVATSTFRIVFAQRLRQFALLRTIGARRGQLVAALATEGAVIGLVTGAAGVLLALAAGLAAPSVAAMAGRTLSGPGVPVGAAVAVVAGAVLLTVCAVLAPAFSAANVPPLHALRTASTAAAERGISAGRVMVGGLLTASAAALGWQTHDAMSRPELSNGVLLYLVGIGACTFGALIAFGPVLVSPVLAVAGRPLRWMGSTGRLAVSVVGGAPRRAAAVSVVVALGVAMLTGAVVGHSSAQRWTDESMAVRAPADLVLFAESPRVDERALGRLRADRRLRNVTPIRLAGFPSAGGEVQYSAVDVDMAALPRLRAVRPAGGPAGTLAPGQAILSSGLATDLHAAVGDTVTLGRAPAALRAQVVAVLPGEAPLRAAAVLAPADLARIGAGDITAGVLADVGQDVDRSSALAGFREVAGSIDAEVAVLADEREQAEGTVSSLLAAALGLLGLTVLIAVVGVGTTTGLSVLERTQESGLLRTLGMNRVRLTAMVGMEAGLYGVIGAVLGAVLGVPLAWLTLEALRLGLPLTFPAGRLLLVGVAVVLITAAAGLLPARRAARVSPIAALATD